MTTVNLLDQIIQPGDDRRRRRCCMNRSGWIAFFHRKRSINSFLVARACRVEPRQRRPLVPSAAGEARAGHAPPRSRHTLAGHKLLRSVDAELDRQVPKCFCLVRGSSSRHKLDHVLPFFFLCRGIELARLLLEQDYSESKQASTHGSSGGCTLGDKGGLKQ